MTWFSQWTNTLRDEVIILGESKRSHDVVVEEGQEDGVVHRRQEEDVVPPGSEKYWTVIAAGAGLFSDGYVNNSIGVVGTCLGILYGDQYTNSKAMSNVASIAFVGSVVGMLVFGYIADYHSRTIGMYASNIILIVFAILASGAWGAGGSIEGMFAAITAYRFFLGIGIGGEYPAGSVAAAEASAIIARGKRNRWFVIFTNFMIDSGFVMATFVPMVLLWICTPKHLTPVWRITLGLGAIPPALLFFLRLRFNANDRFKEHNLKHTKFPYWLIIKYYGPRLVVVSLIWFTYDFSSYAFGIYSSTILNRIIPDGDLYKTFGWNIVLNLFYLPGSFCGAFAADYLGPRLTLVIGMTIQSIIGYFMAGFYGSLEKHVAGFVVVYGFFLTFGEFGSGDNIGLIASKTSATAIRGQYYGIAAAVGKIGAFVGTYVFPVIIKNSGGSDTVKGNQSPFWVSSSLCMFSVFLALFLLPPLTQDSVNDEDWKFREYLAAHGFDVSAMGDVEVRESERDTSLSNEDSIEPSNEKQVESSTTKVTN